MPLDSRDSLAEDGEEFDWPIDVGDSNDGKGTTLDGETIPDSGGHVEASTISIGSQKFIDQAATTHGGRGDESKDGEGDELTRLRKRKGADYSEGHQRIYLSMIKLIGGFETIGKAKILEVGVGIGWGLRNILQDVDIGTYVGVEPCERCVDHVEEDVIKPHLLQQRKRVAGLSKKKQALYQEPTIKAFKQTLLQVPTSTLDKLLKPKADFTFCIEVAEHVDPTERHAFLHRIHKYTSHAFFMSTPNKDTRPQHGALNIAQWTELLKDAGFDNVVAIEWQWTVLYIAT